MSMYLAIIPTEDGQKLRLCPWVDCWFPSKETFDEWKKRVLDACKEHGVYAVSFYECHLKEHYLEVEQFADHYHIPKQFQQTEQPPEFPVAHGYYLIGKNIE